MKRLKLLMILTAVTILSGLISAAAYNSLGNNVSRANPSASTSQPLQLQILSPEENCTYGTYNGPLNMTADEAAHTTTYSLELPINITSNNATAKITYSLDGSANITFNENTTETLTLSYGVHNLTAYACNIEGIASESDITFTVGYGYPLSMKITMGQVQETAHYFESRGLKVQVENIDKSKWQNIINFLYGGSVDVISKEKFADIVIAHGIDTIWVYKDSNQISFYVKVYGESWLPIYYGYSATIV